MSDDHPLLDEMLDRLEVPASARAMVLERHSEPHRHYHTLRHIELMLQQLPAQHAFWRELTAATLFHDIVYNPGRTNNEELSLGTFQSVARELAPGARLDQALVSAMILATKGHAFRDEATIEDAAVNVLLKADLSILWHPDRQVYEWYARGVRQEYAFVADGPFSEARARILTVLRDDLLRSGKLTAAEAHALRRNSQWELQRFLRL
jgi:predicted metal-dependent HD superfamily phosphohydrolase